eukprot:gene4563-6435_t
MEFLKDISRRHEELKKRIHAFRIPLSPNKRRFMGLVYFCIPVVSGYYIMQYTTGQAEKNLHHLTVNKKENRGINQKENELNTRIDEQNQALQHLLNRHKPKDSNA